ncbi:uncharacterized protein [Rutidosis leptorrhynchoides]|uniref:uncharacterized protein isoform X2 n=1 Tax=Rutidosis leptorrhynchoides TaxID=125765 RepID=UPI003A991BB9
MWRTARLCVYTFQHQGVRMQEAKVAKEKMHGKLVCGRPLVVRFSRDKYLMEMGSKTGNLSGSGSNKSNLFGNGSGQMNRSAKIAAIKSKLKAMEEEDHDTKKQKRS